MSPAPYSSFSTESVRCPRPQRSGGRWHGRSPRLAAPRGCLATGEVLHELRPRARSRPVLHELRPADRLAHRHRRAAAGSAGPEAAAARARGPAAEAALPAVRRRGPAVAGARHDRSADRAAARSARGTARRADDAPASGRAVGGLAGGRGRADPGRRARACGCSPAATTTTPASAPTTPASQPTVRTSRPTRRPRHRRRRSPASWPRSPTSPYPPRRRRTRTSPATRSGTTARTCSTASRRPAGGCPATAPATRSS